jgi:hypothetical protein
MAAIDLRLGRWEDVLAGETCDAVIVDAPYSDRTHEGSYGGAMTGASDARLQINKKRALRTAITYSAWTGDDVSRFVSHWTAHCRGWIVSVTDHVLAPLWQSAFESADWYAFAPLPFVELGKMPRMNGDGPASWTCWIVVARPRDNRFRKWGSLDGAYVSTNKGSDDRAMIGGKPLWLMRALIRDYSRKGDLIIDPCAGAATTLLAAGMENRRALGAEVDPETHALAMKRIAAGYTPSLFSEGA